MHTQEYGYEIYSRTIQVTWNHFFVNFTNKLDSTIWDLIALQGSIIETAIAFKKLNLICVCVIGSAQVQDLWNINKIGRFLKGTEKTSEHDLAAGQNSQV